MSQKKTISIPANVGSNNLSDTFGKISFSNEVKELLSALDAEITVRYHPGSAAPVVQVTSSTGKPVCSLEEFKALSGYRRFVSTALKEVEKETSTSEKIKMIAFFVRQAIAASMVIPTRVLESNLTKFNQVGSSIQAVMKNLEVIGTTIDNKWRTYLQDCGTRIIRVLFSTQKACMGAETVSRDYIEEEIFKMGVPKWVYSKFLDKNFTNGLKNDSQVLLFPKNNYLKSIAMTTKELATEPFKTKNKLVLEKSGGIIAMSGADWPSALFPKISDEIKEQVESFKQKYQWVCTSPYPVEEILAIREAGKAPPLFREAMPQRKTGTNQRPESELARTCREISNVLGKIQSTWNGIMNFVVPVANPKTEFWGELMPNAVSWEITPTNTIYNCIRNTPNFKNSLERLRDASVETVLKLISSIILQSLLVPGGTDDAKDIRSIIMNIQDKQKFEEIEDFIDVGSKEHGIHNLEAIENQPPTAEEKTKAKEFLGIFEKQKKSNMKKTGASAVRLHTSVKNELRPLEDHPIYEPVVSWLMTTFKTGDRKSLQLIAAERILGEALKHQEEIFDEDFNEDYQLYEIEEHEDDSD